MSLNPNGRSPAIIDARMDGRTWMMGDDYTIVDMVRIGPIRNSVTFYKTGDRVGFDRFKYVKAWCERMLARLAVQLSVTIPARPDGK